ncbi:hypothetical protein [Micromonospora sp. M71_S20]|uniref:hypothetical protein n=1 Tax=Micromonospora sp. M71_S20 TaxID=592872 RepID=UPI0018F7C636|nr:hypothetical protein [Micromonospora sp. M71_S20]
MGHRLRRVAMLLLGAVLLGTVGLSVGSWYGGRGVTPPSYDRARSVAAELLPDAVPYDSDRVVHGSRWGVNFAADDLGSGQVDFWYDSRADCALSEQLRRNAATQGWQGLRRKPSYPCDDWRAERDGLTVTLAHSASGSRLTVAPAVPDKFLAVTITGTLLGAAAGTALFWLLARRRPPVPLLVGTLVTVGLLPGVGLTWRVLDMNRLAEPVWPIWPALAPLLAPLWLVLLPVGVYALPRRQNRTDCATGSPGMGAEAGTEVLESSRNGTRTVVVVTVACVLTPIVMTAALLLLWARAQPDPAASTPVVPWQIEATASATSNPSSTASESGTTPSANRGG